MSGERAELVALRRGNRVLEMEIEILQARQRLLRSFIWTRRHSTLGYLSPVGYETAATA